MYSAMHMLDTFVSIRLSLGDEGVASMWWGLDAFLQVAVQPDMRVAIATASAACER